MIREIVVLAGFALILIWGWRRTYFHIIRKGSRPLIAHLIGILLSLFPARFFFYASFAFFPPEGAEPMTEGRAILYTLLFAASVIGLYFLTRPRKSNQTQPDQPDQSNQPPQPEQIAGADNKEAT